MKELEQAFEMEEVDFLSGNLPSKQQNNNNKRFRALNKPLKASPFGQNLSPQKNDDLSRLACNQIYEQYIKFPQFSRDTLLTNFVNKKRAHLSVQIK